mmetsp:Transcript_18510/g.24171  ORF Transcript_18510/g.24171 Transcript_18510/m.24171 type:complete len:355 (+) Transcript_18510:90-1154(+)
MVVVQDVIFEDSVANIPELGGKVVAITGTTSGTGYWTAIASIRKGAKVLINLNRQSSRSEKAEAAFKEEVTRCGTNTAVVTIPCDLMSLESVRNAAVQVNQLVSEHSGLDVLINNAGIFMMEDERTEDGFDVTMQVNHLSHFLLTSLLLDSLMKAADERGDARIVNHSSIARWIGPPLTSEYFSQSEKGTLGGNASLAKMNRYHFSKLCNALFTMALHKKFQEKGFPNMKALVADPGLAATEIFEKQDMEGVIGSTYKIFAHRIIPLQSPADGAVPLITASFGSDVKSGDFLAPSKLGITGEPKVVVREGERVDKRFINSYWEKYVVDDSQQNLMWLKSEEVLDVKFFQELESK